MSNISVLILCAGFGKRMLDLTTNVPKPLLKLKKTTLLSNTINFFENIGVDEIYINTHYLYQNIEMFIYKNFKKSQINIIREPTILGTGGGIKNIFHYTKNKNICVVNSDIYWQTDNKKDVQNFIKDFKDVSHCKILLSKNNNFYGLKKNKGDFQIKNGIVSNWTYGTEIIYYSGMQIVSSKIFQNKGKIFPMNEIWNELIESKNLKGNLIQSNILHIGDKNSFNSL